MFCTHMIEKNLPISDDRQFGDYLLRKINIKKILSYWNKFFHEKDKQYYK